VKLYDTNGRRHSSAHTRRCIASRKALLMWWLSDWLYGVGWWPLGALLKIVFWLDIIGLFVIAFILFMGGLRALTRRKEV
jgi:predicted membrane protein